MGIIFLFLYASYAISLVFAVVSIRYLFVKRLLAASILSIVAALVLINPAQERHELIPIIIGYPLLICGASIIMKVTKKEQTDNQEPAINNDPSNE